LGAFPREVNVERGETDGLKFSDIN
jgi:hypothetical protein